MSDRMHSPRGTARRSFLTRLLRSAVTISATGLVARRLPGQSVHVVTSDDWMSQLSGKHRTVFDVAAHRDGKPLTQAKNFLDAWQTAFHAAPSDVNLVVGVHGDAIPFVVDDAMWTAYPIGALYGVTDAGTGKDAVRNVFTERHAADARLVAAEQSVEALQRRGVIFAVCNNTINGASQRLAAAHSGDADAIRSALRSHLLPGVRVVPAMVVALAQLQEHKLSYVKLA